MIYEKHAAHTSHQWGKGGVGHTGKLDQPKQSAPHTHAQRQQHDRCKKLSPPRQVINKPELHAGIEPNQRD